MPHTAQIGNVEVISLLDVDHWHLANFFKTVSPEAWEAYRSLYPDAQCDGMSICTSATAYAIRAGDRTILVDTGIGPGPHANIGGATGQLLDEIGAAGMTPADIDLVVITHLHYDHVGWNASNAGGRVVPTFPNARFLVPQLDWEAFSAPDELERRVYLQGTARLVEQGIVDLVSGERPIVPEVSLLPTPGHTPGHQSIVVASAGEQAVIIGDAAHTPAQVEETSWAPGADMDPVLSSATRRSLFARVEHDHALLCAGHFPHPGMGHLIRREGRRFWQPL